MSDRAERLAAHGRFYAEQGFAVAWTKGITGEDAKRVVSPGWNLIEPLGNPEAAAGFFATYGEKRNPAIVARPSGLILVECDSEEDKSLFAEVAISEMTAGLMVQSSPGRAHFYFRSPLPRPEFVGFRFEAGNVTASRNMYLVAPPALHPTGGEYRFFGELRPPAQMYRDLYEILVHAAGESEKKLSEDLAADPNQKVPKGNRNHFIFRYAARERHYGLSEDAALQMALRLNEERCDPPLSRINVEAQVRGAYGRYPAATAREFDEPVPDDKTSGLSVVFANAIEAQEHRFLDEDKRVPIGGLTCLTGMPGLGKSTLLCFYAARATRSGGKVLLSSSEDDKASVIKPRLAAAGADMSKVAFVGTYAIPRDLGLLEETIREHGFVLVGLDPLTSHLEGVKSSDDGSVRRALDPLNEMARDLQCAVVALMHVNKSFTSDPMLRASGSLAGFMGPARSAMELEGTGLHERTLTHFKSSWTERRPPTDLVVESRVVYLDGKTMNSSVIVKRPESVSTADPWSDYEEAGLI